MNTSEKSFNQAWQKLTTGGEACSEKISRDFTPAGIRKNVQEEGLFYHDTKADLKVGTYLKMGILPIMERGKQQTLYTQLRSKTTQL